MNDNDGEPPAMNDSDGEPPAMNRAMNDNDGDAAPSCPPQQSTTKKRRRFSVQEKMSFVIVIRRRMETDQVSLRKACKDVNIHHKQYVTWNKEFNTMEEAKNNKAKSLCSGRSSILKSIEEELLQFIFELREQGMAVSTTMVMSKAASLSRAFREKSREAQYHSARRFVRSHGLV